MVAAAMITIFHKVRIGLYIKNTIFLSSGTFVSSANNQKYSFYLTAIQAFKISIEIYMHKNLLKTISFILRRGDFATTIF